MRRIKIAQIGIEHDHARKIMSAMRDLPEIFEVVGWCDPEKCVEYDEFTGKQVVAGIEYKGDTNIYRHLYDGVPEMELEELLNYPGLEAVVIESSEYNLFKYAQIAAERGLHVHMDKPGGLSYADFEKLVETVRSNGKVLHLGYMYRYNPANKEHPFTLDSKEPTASFRDFLLSEVRYSALQRTFPEIAEELFVETEKNAKDRLESYKKLANG